MIVRVTLSIPIDEQKWNLNYMTGLSKSRVRDDVKHYVDSLVHEHFFNLDVLSTKEAEHERTG